MTPPPTPLDPDVLMSHAAALRGLARHLVADEHAAEDLVQETLALALERPPRETRGLAGWLRVSLRHVAFKRTRSERGRSEREQATARPEELPSTVSLVEHRALLEGVAGALLGLHEPYQTALFLRYFEDLPPRAISARLGVNEATIKSRLHRGLALLRERLDEKHDGGRAAWAGVALAWSGDSAKKGLTGALGGWLMGKNVALVGVALALVGTLVWLGRGGPLSEPGTGMVFDDSSAQFDGNREPLEEPQDIEAPPIPPPSDTGAAGRGEGEDALAAQGSTPSGAGAKPKEPEVEPPIEEVIETPPLPALPENLLRNYDFVTNLELVSIELTGSQYLLGVELPEASIPGSDEMEMSVKLTRSLEALDISGSQAAPYDLIRTFNRIENRSDVTSNINKYGGVNPTASAQRTVVATTRLHGASVGFLSNPPQVDLLQEGRPAETIPGVVRDLSGKGVFRHVDSAGAQFNLSELTQLFRPGGDLQVQYRDGDGEQIYIAYDRWGPGITDEVEPRGHMSVTSSAIEYVGTFPLTRIKFTFELRTEWSRPMELEPGTDSALANMQIQGERKWTGTGEYVWDPSLEYLRSVTLEGEVDTLLHVTGQVAGTEIEVSVTKRYKGDSKFTLTTGS